MTERDAEVMRRLAKLEKDMRDVLAIKNMGRGVLWVGAVAFALAGLAVAVWKALTSAP